jgi:hypothetical protein
VSQRAIPAHCPRRGPYKPTAQHRLFNTTGPPMSEVFILSGGPTGRNILHDFGHDDNAATTRGIR